FGELLRVEAVAVEIAGGLGALVDLARVALADPLLDRARLGGAEEVAVEDQVIDAAVVLGLGDRRRQCLAEVGLRGPGHEFECREGVEDLGGPDRDPLAAQLLAEAEQLGAEPRWAGVRLRAVGRSRAHHTDNRAMSGADRSGGMALVAADPVTAMKAMRTARRRRYVQRADVMEVLYRVYLGGLAAIFIVAFLAGALHEVPADPGSVASIRAHAAAALG